MRRSGHPGWNRPPTPMGRLCGHLSETHLRAGPHVPVSARGPPARGPRVGSSSARLSAYSPARGSPARARPVCASMSARLRASCPPARAPAGLLRLRFAPPFASRALILRVFPVRSGFLIPRCLLAGAGRRPVFQDRNSRPMIARAICHTIRASIGHGLGEKPRGRGMPRDGWPRRWAGASAKADAASRDGPVCGRRWAGVPAGTGAAPCCRPVCCRRWAGAAAWGSRRVHRAPLSAAVRHVSRYSICMF